MDRKTVWHSAFALVLALAGLAALFGLLSGANEPVYAAARQADPQRVEEPSVSRVAPLRASLPEVERAPLMNGVEASTVITVCSAGCDYASVQAAVSAAPEGALVKVAQGDYGAVELTKTLTLRGGYTTTNWLISRPDEHPTVLDGEGITRVVRISDGDPTVEGFHITDGAANEGAGVYIAGGEPVVRRNRIYGNAADGDTGAGGGVHVAGGSPLLENNLIYTNTSVGLGGGVYVNNGSAALRYNTLYDNRADNGGGVYVEAGSPVISASIIVSNTADVSGGGGGVAKAPELVGMKDRVLYNDLFGNSPNDYAGFLDGNPELNISEPPLFVGPLSSLDAANFRLQADSLCRGRDDQRYPNAYPDDDYDGYARPFGQYPDMGAHEHYAPSDCYAQRVSPTARQVYTNVQDAVGGAAAGDLVKVTGYCTGTDANVVLVNEALSLQGGYTKTYWVESYPDVHRTVLDGEGERRVIYIDQAGAAAIEGFDIYNGFVTGGASDDRGGGIYVKNSDSNLTIRHNRIYSNRVAGSGKNGGGIYLSGKDPVVASNEIYSNVAAGSGGGIYVFDDVQGATITDNRIYGNSANNGAGIYSDGEVFVRRNWIYSNATTGEHGGGIHVRSGAGQVEDNWIYTNTAVSNGGGIYLGSTSNVLVIGNRIYDNVANAPPGLWLGGGGIFANAGIIRGNVISGNQAATRGGGVFAYNLGTIVERNRIYGNKADVRGGGVLLQNHAEARNNVVYTNTAEHGGGISARNGYIINNVIYDNAASGSGGGTYRDGDSVWIYGNIIVSNTSGSGGGGIQGGDDVVLNNVWGNTPSDCNPTALCDGNLSVDPLFEDWVDFYLQPDSSCIDAITTTDKTYYADDDYDGYARPFGRYADMGAHEFYTGTCFARLSDGGRVYDVVQEAVVTATAGVSDVLVAGTCEGAAAMATIDKSIGLRGGYTITDWLTPTEPTILDAQGLGRVITITAGADDVTVERLVVMGGDAGAGNGGGVYVSAALSPTIQNVVFYSNTGGGFASTDGNPRLYHNTVVLNDGDGLYFVAGAPVVSSTIVVSNTGDGIEAAAGSPVLAYNNVTGHSTDYNSVTAGETDISESPRFATVNGAAEPFFRLAFDSPGLHTADPGSGVHDDFEGDLRPDGDGDGERYDIGADEATDYLGLDLSPDSVSLDGIAGVPVDYTYYLSNTGTHDDDYSLTHTLHISGSGSGWSAVYDADYALAVDEAAPVDVTIQVPSDAASGTVATLLMTATSSLGEPYFFDVVTGVVTVRKDWGFDLSPSTSAQSGDPGTVVTHTHYLTNTGGPDTFTLTLSSRYGWADVTPPGPVSLGSGQSTALHVRVTLPETASDDVTGVYAEETVLEVTSAGSVGAGDPIQKSATDATSVNEVSGDRYVATTGDDERIDGIGLNSCRLETSPCASVKHAVGQANTGETVRVAGGTYDEFNININKNIVLQGGYTETDWNEADPEANRTIIDANQQGRVLYLGSTPRVEGFTLQNARYNGQGGGVYVAFGASPVLHRLVITGNVARSTSLVDGRGGGVYNAGGDPTLERSIVAGNSAGKEGGGFYNHSGDPSIWNTMFYDNETGGSDGGGFYNQAGNPQVWHNTFVYNSAEYGGGVYLSGGSPDVRNTIIVSNTASVSGGGIYSAATNATVDYNDVWGNTGGDYEGLSAGTNSTSTHPLFVDPAGRDFHLLKASPCRDVGDTLVGGPAEDFDGQPRVMNGTPDLGADEYQRADVELVSLDDHQIGLQGEMLTYTHRLTNTGNYDDYYLLTWQSVLTHGWVVTVDGSTTQPVTVPLLGQYEATTVDVHIRTPDDVLSNTINTTIITATSQWDTEVHDTASNETVAGRTVDVAFDPSREGWSPCGPSSVATDVVYTHTLVNEGNYTDTFDLDSWSEPVFDGSTYTPWDVNISPSSMVVLAKDQSTMVVVTVTIPIWATEVQAHRTVLTATSQTDVGQYAVLTDTTIAARCLGIELAPDRAQYGETGESILYTHTLTNTGNYTDTYVFTATSQLGWPVTVDDQTPPVALDVGAWPPHPDNPGTRAVTVRAFIPAPPDAFGADVDTLVITATSVASPSLSASVTNVTTATQEEGVDVYPDYRLLYDDETETDNDKFVERLVLTSGDQNVVFTHTVYNNNTSNSTDTFTITVASVPPRTLEQSHDQIGPLRWHGVVTDVVVTATVPYTVSHPALAEETTVWLTATSWFSPTGVHGYDTVRGVIIVNQWRGVELPDGESRTGSPGDQPYTAGSLAYARSLTNTGNYTDSYELRGSTGRGWSVAFSGAGIVDDQTADIGPEAAGNGVRSFTTTVGIPFEMCGTTDTLRVTAETRTPDEGIEGDVDGKASDTVTDVITVGPVYYVDLTPGFTVRYTSTDVVTRSVGYGRQLTNTGNCTNTFDLGVEDDLNNVSPVTMSPTTANDVPSVLADGHAPTPLYVTLTVPSGYSGFGDLLTGTLVITADGQNGGPEDYGIVTDTVVINQHVDVALAPDGMLTTSVAGVTPVLYTHTLTNTGNYKDAFDLTWWNEDEFEVSVSADDGTNWSSDEPVSTGELSPGEAIEIGLQVSVPADVYTLTNRTWLTATSQTPITGTAGYTPTATVTDTLLVRRPHVTIAPDYDEDVDPGLSHIYTHTLENTGGLMDSYTVTCASLHLGHLGWLDDCGPEVINLSPGATRTITVAVSVPSIGQPGNYDDVVVSATSWMSYTYVVSDTALDRTNVRYKLDADLSVEPAQWADPGETVTFTHRLTNTGNFTEVFTLEVVNQNFSVVNIDPIETGDLPPAKAITVTITVAPYAYAPGGELEQAQIDVFGVNRATQQRKSVESVVDTVYISYTTGTRFVHPDGDDANNNCTMRDDRTPCLTVQHAVDQALHGDTIKVAQGVYYDELEAAQVVSVTKSITLSGGYADDWDLFDPVNYPTTLDGEGERRVMAVGSGVTPTIEGFHLVDGYVDGDGAGLYVASGAEPTVRQNRIYSNTAAGGASQGGGVYYGGGGDITLARNAIYDNAAGYGAGLYTVSGNSRIWNNLFYHNDAESYGGGLYSADGDPLMIWHNTFYSNTAYQGGGVYVLNGAPVISNTIVVGNANIGIYAPAASKLSHNNVWNNLNADGDPADYAGNVSAGADDISKNPRFVSLLPADPADLRLTYGSPCINAGGTSELDVDYEGNERPLRGGYDVGGYEYGLIAAKRVTETARTEAVITYTVSLTNTGRVSHTYRLTDTLHPYLESTGFLTYSIGSGSYYTPTGEIDWTGPMDGNDTVETITFTARIRPGIGAGAVITNLAWVDHGPLAVVTTTVAQITGTRYVVTNGSDVDNDCTLPDDPCLTVQRAVDQASDGDTIKVAAGTYEGLSAGQVVSVSKAITLTGGYADDPFNWDLFDPGEYETTLQAKVGDPYVVTIGPAMVRLAGFHIVDAETAGVHVSSGGDLTLERSWVHGNADGVLVDDGAYLLVNTIVAQNTGAGLRTMAGSDGEVVHATFAENAAGAVITGASRITNTIFATHTVGVDVATGSTAHLWHTLWWGNDDDYDANTIRVTDVFSDPVFVDPDALDYHIQETSGAIDQGVLVPWVTEDIDGEARVVMFGPDIGADEYPVGLDKYGPAFAEAGQVITYRIELKAVDDDLVVTDVLPLHLTYVGPVTCTTGNCIYTSTLDAIVWQGDSEGDVTITYTASITNWLGRDYEIINTAELERQGVVNPSSAWHTVITPVHTTRYVVPAQDGGLDVETDGTPNSCQQPGKPCATIQWAIGQALPDDVIKVANGVYTSTAAQVALVDKSLTLRGGCDPADSWVCDPLNSETRLDGEDNRRAMVVIGTSGDVTATVDGFHLLNGRSTQNGGGLLVNAAVVTLLRSQIYSNTAVGSSGGGIYLFNAPAVELSGNWIYANTAGGSGGGVFAFESNYTLINNVIVRNAASGTGDGAYFGSCTGRMLHNTIADNEGVGVWTGGTGASMAMTNTIVSGHTSCGVWVVGGSATADHTLWYENNTPYRSESGASFTDENPVTSDDPLFVNPETADYHIQPGSAAFDAGAATDVVTDIDDEARPMGLDPDVGADELRVSLSVVKTVEPEMIEAGALLTYTIRVTNTGLLTLTAAITDILPATVVPSNPVTWTGRTINPGAVWNDIITAETTISGTIVNRVEVSTAEGAMDSYVLTSTVGGDPEITVDPMALSAMLAPNETTTRTLTVGNVGRAALNWHLTEVPTVTWLSESITNGVEAPGESTPLTVTFDADGLSDGTYTTTLQVDSDDPVSPSVDVGVTLTVCTPVANAAFTHTLVPQVNQATFFTGSVSAGTDPVVYTWDFGDGDSDVGEVVSHTYATSDTFTVVMTATNCYGSGVETASRDVHVIGAPDITVDPLQLAATLEPDTTTTRTLTIDNGGTAALTWSLVENPDVDWLSESSAGGTIDRDDSEMVTVTFNATNLDDNKIYTTTLQVLSDDPDMPQVDVSVVLTVSSGCIPVSGADFTFAPLAPMVGQTVTFTGSVTGGTDPIVYTWDFGDDTVNTGQVVEYVYSDPLTYTVRMTATNCSGSGVSMASQDIGVKTGIYLPLVLRNN